MKVMRELTELGSKHEKTSVSRTIVPSADKNSWEFLVNDLRHRLPHFVCIVLQGNIPVQDTIHLGAKLRVRLLKTLLFLVIGDKVATPAHIISMQNQFSKDQHNLREGDLLLEDKMNYDAVRRLCNLKVRSLLTNIPGLLTFRYFGQWFNYPPSD
jgi:hypothetical protein